MRLKHTLILFASIVVLFFASCKKGGDDVHFVRYEQTLFETSAQEMPEALRRFGQQFPSSLLAVYPDDANFVQQVAAFTADPTVRDIYDITQGRFADLSWLERELADALRLARKADDDIRFDHFATFVSGLSDYDGRVAVDRQSGSLVVSIDFYALPAMEKYSYFGYPKYILERLDSAYMAVDIMSAIARQFVAAPDEASTSMLDIMIAEGKVLYFLDKVFPRKDDRLKIRYDEEQLRWMRDNESRGWAYFIHNNLLYEKDFARYHNFVDEAPKTNAFAESAPRTTHYIGWQIVRRYMAETGCTMRELFDNTNSQAILQTSKYKP